jgi:isopenicillin N synthase-like dioxygenase
MTNPTPTPLPSLPLISLAPFLAPSSPTSARLATATALAAACTNYGFFYLTDHGIPASTTSRVLSLATQFFQLPTAEKTRIARHDAGGPEHGDGARGYQPLGDNVTKGRRDRQEAVDWYREVPSAGPPYPLLRGPNLWPERPAELRGVYEAYVGEVLRVGEVLVRAMGMALGLGPAAESAGDGEERGREDEEVFVRRTREAFWVMRMIGYPALEPASRPGGADRVGGGEAAAGDDGVEQLSCGEHTDYGCVTLLLADATVGALQVQLKDGAWINADPVPGAFVVNIGDMMETWTNGLWKSTRHRVIHRGEGFRVSVPFFYEPDWDVVVRPLRKCVERTGGVELYPPVKYGDHLTLKALNNFYAEEKGDD